MAKKKNNGQVSQIRMHGWIQYNNHLQELLDYFFNASKQSSLNTSNHSSLIFILQ